MAWLKKCLGIDVGTTSVKISEMVAEKSGVRITQIHRADVDLPPGPLDATRMDEIAKAVRTLISEHKITTKHAVFSVPGQNVFIRRIRFPRTNEERMHRIVAYEAKQQIPFPPESSLMEYQVFDYGDSAEVEVLLAAIKSDIVTEFMNLVNKCGLKPVMISVTSLALFNFHVFDSTPFADMLDALKEQQSGASAAPVAVADDAEPEKKKKGIKIPKMSFGKKKKLDADDVMDATLPEDMSAASLQIDELPAADDMFEEVKGYINIGSQTFDLAIARHGKRKMLGFTRSVAWAGGELTRLLTSQLGVDVAQAEQLKRTEIVLPSSLDVSDAEPSQATEVAIKWAEKMVLEIRKSFDFYIAQPDGMAVDNIVLSGGGAEVKGLAAFIEDRLGVPVEVREAPQNPDIVLTERPDGGDLLTSYLVSFGLALSGLGFGHVTADFLPRELKTIREFKKKKTELIVMAALLLAIIGLSTILGTTEISAMRSWLSSNSSTLQQATQDQQALGTARSERQTVESNISAIGTALGDRAYWVEFMAILESMKPAGVTFTQMELQPDGKIILFGVADVQQNYLDMLDAMKNAPDWIKPDSPQLTNAGPMADPVTRQTKSGFGISAESVWKRTRLEPARVTMTPGQWTPTPAPTGTPAGGMYPGMY